MENRLKWVDGQCFIGETESGHAVVMDGPESAGGRNRGPRMMELLLHGAAGCTAWDVVTILKKQRKDLRDLWIDIKYDKAQEDPKVFTAIHFHFVFTGRGLQATDVEKVIALSADKYCGASIMLAKSAKFTRTFEIREAD